MKLNLLKLKRLLPIGLLFITWFLLSATVPTSSSTKENRKRFVGIWEMVVAENESGIELRVPPGYLKFFGKDGSYMFVIVTPEGAFNSQQGSFKVLSEDIYSENIKFSINPNLRNAASKVSYSFLNEDTLQIKGTVNGVPFVEKWKRVKTPVI
ncbi:DUF4488 domain-containing protein [Sphingobacterium psychroaquaticum]|uniref:DUF4488 domain-containing protein n=1 Tax=Sphingobacterium psychroaquaticum TaxID=561061 RepID=UPI00106DBEE3|nr:DUF4488 domain-containing protein [Sphingobacterium psychroaquaticum]QBQ41937.1 DUF4488 domain-containing protein [Sphingobacterium psychroaquaticum]